MNVGELIDSLSTYPRDKTVALQHPKRGFTTLTISMQELAVPLDYDRVDGGEFVKMEGGEAILTLSAGCSIPVADEPASPRRLFFCHIPKTAGGALSRSVRSLFPVDAKVMALENTSVLFNTTDAELRATRLIMGHIGATLARRLPQDTITLTVLRDPVSRVVSLYNFFRQRQVIEPGLMNFVTKRGNAPEIDNVSAWMLAHDFSLGGRRQRPDLNDEGKLRDEAIRTLQKFNIIGVSETVAEVLDMLEIIYEARPADMERVNEVKKEVETPSPDEIEAIKNLNRVDQSVYDEAVRIKDQIWEKTRQLVIEAKPTNHFV